VIIDISDRSNPSFVSSIRIADDQTYGKLFQPNLITEDSDDYIYFTYQEGAMIIDISNKASPSIASHFYTAPYAGDDYSPGYLSVDNDTLYLAANDNGVMIYDITNPAAPVNTKNITDLDGVVWVMKHPDKNLIYAQSNGDFYILALDVPNTTAHFSPYFYFDQYIDYGYTVEVWANPDETYGDIDNSSSLVFTAYDWMLNYTPYYDWQRSIDQQNYVNSVELLSSSRNKTLTIQTDVYFVQNDDNVFSILPASQVMSTFNVDAFEINEIELSLYYDMYAPNTFGHTNYMLVDVVLSGTTIDTVQLTGSDYTQVVYSGTPFLWDGEIQLQVVDSRMRYPGYLDMNEIVVDSLNSTEYDYEDTWNYSYVDDFAPNNRDFFHNRIINLHATSPSNFLYDDTISMFDSTVNNNYFTYSGDSANFGGGYYLDVDNYNTGSGINFPGNVIDVDHWTQSSGFIGNYRQYYTRGEYTYDIPDTPAGELDTLNLKFDAYASTLDYYDNFFQYFVVSISLINPSGATGYGSGHQLYPTSSSTSGTVNKYWLDDTEITNSLDNTPPGGIVDKIRIRIGAYFGVSVPYPNSMSADDTVTTGLWWLMLTSTSGESINEDTEYNADTHWTINETLLDLGHGGTYDIWVTTDNITNVTDHNVYTGLVEFQTSDYYYYEVPFYIESIVPTINYDISLNYSDIYEAYDLGLVTVGEEKLSADIFLYSETKAWCEYSYNFIGEYDSEWFTTGYVGFTNDSISAYHPDYVNIIDVLLVIYSDDPNTPNFTIPITVRVEPLYTNYIDFGNTSKAYRVLEVYNTYGLDDIYCQLGFEGVNEYSYYLEPDTSYFRMNINRKSRMEFTTQNKHTELTFTMRSSSPTAQLYYRLNDGDWISIYGVYENWSEVFLSLSCEDDGEVFIADNVIEFKVEGSEWVDILLSPDSAPGLTTTFFDATWYSSAGLNLRHDLVSRDIWSDEHNYDLASGDYHFSNIYYTLTGNQHLAEEISGNITIDILDADLTDLRMTIKIPFEVRPAYGDYIIIISDMDELFVTVYYAEDNEFEISFTNLGTVADSIVSLNTSLGWVDPGFFQKALDPSTPTNITFFASEGISANYRGESIEMQVDLITYFGVHYTGTMYLTVDARSTINVIPTFLDLERDQGETIEFAITVSNDGFSDGSINVYWSYVGDGFPSSQLELVDSTYSFFVLPPDTGSDDHQVTIWFKISGDVPDVTDEWIIYIEDTSSNTTIEVLVTCKTAGVKKSTWEIWAYIILASSVMAVGAFVMRPSEKYKKFVLQQKEYQAKNEFVEAESTGKKIPWFYRLRYMLGIGTIIGGVLILVWALLQVWQGYAENPFGPATNLFE
jgi:hypothetical protein